MEKSYYRNLLKIAKENNISPWRLLCASSVSSYDLKLTDEEFDLISDFVYDWVMGSECATPDIVMDCIYHLIKDDEIKVSDFGNYDKEREITGKINEII